MNLFKIAYKILKISKYFAKITELFVNTFVATICQFKSQKNIELK